MNAKRYLLQYRNMAQHAERLTHEIESLMATAESMNQIGDGMPRGSNVSDRVANVAVALADMRNDYQYQIIEMWAKRKEIVAVINSVDNPMHSQLLYDRYILFMKWADIAEDIHADESYTRGRLHGTALLAIDRIINRS